MALGTSSELTNSSTFNVTLKHLKFHSICHANQFLAQQRARETSNVSEQRQKPGAIYKFNNNQSRKA